MSELSIADFTYTLAANEEIPIPMAGNYIGCTQGESSFHVLLSGINKVALIRGLSGTTATPFTNVKLINGATAQTITLYIGFGDIRDSRFSLTDNVIDVVDGSKKAVKDNMVFTLQKYQNNSIGDYNQHQVYNPADSGYRVLVHEIHVTDMTAGAGWAVRISATEIGISSGVSKSLLAGGSDDADTHNRELQDPTLASGDQVLLFNSLLNITFPMPLKKPIILPEGYGCIVANLSINVDTRIVIVYEKELIV